MQDYDREYTIMKVGKNGFSVMLDDGSQWQIDSCDNTKVACWYETMRIKISEDFEDETYPFQLTNLNTSEPDIVRARRK